MSRAITDRSSNTTRVLFLIDGLGIGGAERLLPLYLKELGALGFSVRVCALSVRQGNPVGAQLEAAGIEVDLVPVGRLRHLHQVLHLAAYLRRQPPDLVHTQLEFANTLGCFLASRLGVPAVSTLHTLDDPVPGTRSHRRKRLMWWVLNRYCERIICVSEVARQHHLEVGRLSPRKLITHYNGIDLDPFERVPEERRDQLRSRLGIEKGAPVLTTVAVLRRDKGIQHMIGALPALVGARPSLRYLVVGDGPHRRSLEDLVAARALGGHVIFTGSRDDIPDLLALAEVFVLPTLIDALPTALMEAMASRLPVVASRVGGVPELVAEGHNGLLVSPGDEQGLAGACRRLLDDPGAAARMGESGRHLVAQRFNLRVQVAELARLYQQVLHARREAAA